MRFRKLRKSFSSLIQRIPSISGFPERWNEKRKNLKHLRRLREFVPGNEVDLRQEYERSGLKDRPDTFVLYRIIGNDIYPRHEVGQSLRNLSFVLENEPEFESCEKRWILNRIIDAGEEQAIIDLLESYRKPYSRIPFDPAEYRSVGLDEACLPEPGFLSSERFTEISEKERKILTLAAYRLRNNYVMNNNGARNVALRDGRLRAKWIIPADGNCIFTCRSWEMLRNSVIARPHLRYFVVPMARLGENRRVRERRFKPKLFEEPQLVFRSDSTAEFDERFCYGRRPKVELFWRLGIPGKWDTWKDHTSDQRRNPRHAEAGQFGVAGWVARLSSGLNELETGAHKSFLERGVVRQQAIIATLEFVTDMVRSGNADDLELRCYSQSGIESMRNECEVAANSVLSGLAASLISEADEALHRGPYSVIDKTTLPPSGEARDYWHPAPYWWPNPLSRDGLPYVQRDGERVPGTRMYEPESDRYDRSRLQRMFDDSTVLALAWAVSREIKYAAHAARLVRTWFIDTETRMNPHLNCAQVRMGHNGNRGASTGIIEFKDLYYFLDAVRLIEPSGALDESDRIAFKCWMWKYLNWLQTSPQGIGECNAKNNHGTYYDLQLGAIAAYLGMTNILDDVLGRAEVRLQEQFLKDGSQPLELRRRTSAHYCCFNIQGWINLADLARTHNRNLWQRNGEISLLSRGVLWMISHIGNEWPFEQLEWFDTERFEPIVLAALRVGIEIPHNPVHGDTFYCKKPRFFPHDGIQPYWNIPEK